MLTQFTATVVDGMLRPDEPIGLPNDSRVTVVIAPVPLPSPSADPVAAWEEMKRYADEHPMGSGGRKFSRDELYDRH
jgi:hypothetical protein